MRRVVFLVVAVALLLPTVAFGGGQKEAPAAEVVAELESGAVINRPFDVVFPRTGERGRTVVIDRFKASPMLKAQVEAGQLPPVDQRLPEEPLVLQPIESVGRYGGWMRSLRFPIYLNTLSQRHLLEHLVAWTTPYYEELNPNVAKGWDVSADATTTTFYLREGMKWSDGTPFTADAIVWWFEHIIKNDDLSPSKPAFLLTRGNLPTVTAVDKTTVRFTFTHPNPAFIENAARIRPMPYAPGHYLAQFHPDFVSQAEVERVTREGDFDTWMAMFNDKRNFYGNPDLPGISAWVPLNHQAEEVARFQRNPYFWKVDTEGKQLPYIDGIDHPFVQDAEAWFLQALAGELTYAASGFIGGRPNLPLLLENQERGGFRVVQNYWPPNNLSVVLFNFGHPDPVKRQVIDDRRFRMALTKAIDYEEVNQVIYEGEAAPSWPQSSDHFGTDHELYSRYIGRDLNLANSLLDEMGLTARDSEGFRLGPDGNRMTFIGLTSTAWPTETPEVVELYRGYFEQIGIRMVTRVQAGQLVGQMVQAGEFDLVVGSTAPGGRPMNIYDRGVLNPTSVNWGIARNWAQWLLTDGAEGVEPPDYVKRLRQIQEDGMVEPSEEVRDALIEEALEIWVENFLVVPGFSEPRTFQYYVIKDNVRNFSLPGEPNPGEIHTTPSSAWYFE